MVEDAVAVREAEYEVARRLEGTFGSNSGSGGGCGGLGVHLCLPSGLDGSTTEGIAGAGGEYWVPASTVAFVTEKVDKGRLCGFGATVGD